MGMIALMLAWQATPAIAPPATLLDIPFDLAHPPAPSPSPADIVVTGRRPQRRLPPLPELHENLVPRAQTDLFGGTAAIVTEAAPLPGGATSNRVMLRWKKKF